MNEPSELHRLNTMTVAITMGTSKADFKFESEYERIEWEILSKQIEDIIAAGYGVDILRE